MLIRTYVYANYYRKEDICVSFYIRLLYIYTYVNMYILPLSQMMGKNKIK